jgi:hypothetical protein
MTDLPDLKIKALVSFPAAVHGGTGLAVRQENGVYTFDLDYGELAQISSIPTPALPTTFLALWESTQDTYRRMSVPDLQTQIGGGGGGGPSPATATPLIESGAGAVGISLNYAREDHVHPALGGGGGASVLVSDTPPVGAADNSLWWESDSGNLFIRYNDGNSAQWVAAASGGTVASVNDRRSAFRNAAFDVWQRGASPAAAAVGSYGYTADGWAVAFAGANGLIGRAFNTRSGARSLYALQLTGATSCTGAVIKQRIESLFAAPLAGKSVTVQAQITNNTGASITPTMVINRPNAQDNWSGFTNELSTQSLQACPNGATTLVAYTATLSANAINGLEVIFDFGGSLSSNAKTLAITECDVQITAGVANGLNASPPLATLRSVAEEIPVAYRYLFPVAQGASGGSTAITPVGFKTSNTTIDMFFSNPVPMRGPPSLVGGAGVTWQGSNPTTGNTLAFFDQMGVGFLGITGALTVLLAGGAIAGQGGVNGSSFRAQAATSFTGTAGDGGNFYVGPLVNLLASAEL